MLERESGPCELVRPTGTATLSQPGQPERRIALPPRRRRDCLAEELRRLDADEVYAEVLTKGLKLLHSTGSAKTAGKGASGRHHPPDAAPRLPPPSPMTGRRQRRDGARGVAARRRPHGCALVTAPATVVVHRDAGLLAEAAAARLVTRLVDAQATRGRAHVVLTGGGVGTATLRRSPPHPPVTRSTGRPSTCGGGTSASCEAGHPDRNETQAREGAARPRARRRGPRARHAGRRG